MEHDHWPVCNQTFFKKFSFGIFQPQDGGFPTGFEDWERLVWHGTWEGGQGEVNQGKIVSMGWLGNLATDLRFISLCYLPMRRRAARAAEEKRPQDARFDSHPSKLTNFFVLGMKIQNSTANFFLLELNPISDIQYFNRSFFIDFSLSVTEVWKKRWQKFLWKAFIKLYEYLNFNADIK